MAGENPDGRIIGQYRIVRTLGRGAQGVVYLAEDTKLGRKVALKVLTAVPALSPRAAQRFRREAEVTARLDHPGICTTYDFGTEEGVPWIAMRYVEGETLSTKIARARSDSPATLWEHESLSQSMPESAASGETAGEPSPSTTRTPDEIAWVVRIVEQAARALHVAHEHGVIHRDIKPVNIMVGTDDMPVILDFGLANVAEDAGPTLTTLGQVVGTPHYIAPEQLLKDPVQIDRRADVYSLGITLYEALTFSRPFESHTRERLFHAILTKEAPDPRRLNPAISRDLAAVTFTAIDKDRDRRYKTALDFADDLRRTLRGEPVAARHVGPFGRLSRWARRNPAIAASVASAFAILLAALVIVGVLLAQKARAVRDVESLADGKRLRDLRAEADDLWPALPAKAEGIRSWLKRADALADRLPKHEAAMAELREREARGDSLRTEDEWRRDHLGEIVADLKAFADPDPRHGLLAEMRKRLANAETISKRSIEDHSDRWTSAVASVRDPERSPKYHGLKLIPQVGLVPIGQNATTGLWEFAVLDTGAIPGTGSRPATPGFDEASGIVLVLLPGGKFGMGSAPDESNRGPDETLREVEVAPFFIGKHEITQAQYQRITGTNPSLQSAGRESGITAAHPVENVDWFQCAAFGRCLNLTLPTEAQWEYACRADTSTPCCWGAIPDDLEKNANVADESFQAANPKTAGMVVLAPWNDGFPYHAPVQAFTPNPWGLFGFHGNVAEWCLDWYRPEAIADPAAVARAARENPEAATAKSYRDGSWATGPATAHAAQRHRLAPRTHISALGFRVARALDREP